MRKYGFVKEDIILDSDGNLNLAKDPKELWAEKHPELFPVKLNRAGREELLRVPGLGPDTVKRILKKRMEGRIRRPEDLGVKGKRLDKIKRHVVFE